MMAGGRAPCALHLEQNTYRIYFAAYDQDGRGRIFSLDIDITRPQDILHLHSEAYVDIGHTGFFNDNGIIPSWILKHDERILMYTIGFSKKNQVMFDAASGLAVSDDDGRSFQAYNGTVLDRSFYDPCFAASPCVLYNKETFHMWYVSCDKWEHLDDGTFRHYYNIKYKQSDDGIHWQHIPQIAVDYQNQYEYAISRPSVFIEPSGLHRMWYSYRAQENIKTYRIGYAESEDGINWTRKDHLAGIDVSESGWDSEMICYPYVFQHQEKKYMLYNGNGYGKSGFGLAVLENEK